MNGSLNLKQRVEKIEKRNQKVEADKAWETSWFRRLFILIATYLLIGLLMASLDIEKPWINALIPSWGFILSTLSLPLLKAFWIRHIYTSTKK